MVNYMNHLSVSSNLKGLNILIEVFIKWQATGSYNVVWWDQPAAGLHQLWRGGQQQWQQFWWMCLQNTKS